MRAGMLGALSISYDVDLHGISPLNLLIFGCDMVQKTQLSPWRFPSAHWDK